MPPHVLVLGGGYVPITLTRELRRQVERGEIDVTVVSRDNFHTFHGFVGEMITGRIGPSSMLSPVRRIFAPAKVHVAEIESIDLDARKVVTSRHLDGARFELDYDHLVLCLGSTREPRRLPGPRRARVQAEDLQRLPGAEEPRARDVRARGHRA